MGSLQSETTEGGGSPGRVDLLQVGVCGREVGLSSELLGLSEKLLLRIWLDGCVRSAKRVLTLPRECIRARPAT
jgi:hypothetical protein